MPTFIGRLGIIPFISIGLFFFAYQFYKNRKSMGTSVMIRLILACVLMIVASFSSLSNFSTWTIATIGVWGMHFSVLLLCIAIKQQINKEPYIPITRYPIFWITTIISITTTVLQYTDRTNLTPFVDNKPFNPTFNYYAAALLGYSTMVWLIGYIAALYIISIIKYTNTAYRLRQGIIATGFAVAFLSVLMTDYSIVIYIQGNHNDREHLSALYHLSKPIYYSIFIVGFMTPAFIIDYISDKIDRLTILIKRRLEQCKIMLQLHDRITSRAPRVRLPINDPEMQKSRIMIEIPDAHDYMWSQEPYDKEYITPEDDLKKILELEANGKILLEMGEYTPPPLKTSPLIHYLILACMLRKHPRLGITENTEENTELEIAVNK